MKKFWFILFFHLTVISVFAINDSVPSRNNILKLNITQLILSEVDLSYEYCLPSTNSLETSIGLVFPSEIFKSLHEENFHYNGFMISTQYKLRLLKKVSENFFYFSPLFKFKYLYYDDQLIKRRTGEGAYIYFSTLEDSRKQTYTLELLFGVQNRNKFILDFYMGIGIRCISFQKDKKEFSNNYPDQVFYSYPSNDTFFRPTVHLGLKFGFDYRKR